MSPKESCERFEMFLSSIAGATKIYLPTVQQSLDNGDQVSASKNLVSIRESIDETLSAFDRLLEMSGEPRRYESIYVR